jgi:hypothetical protein
MVRGKERVLVEAKRWEKVGDRESHRTPHSKLLQAARNPEVASGISAMTIS